MSSTRRTTALTISRSSMERRVSSRCGSVRMATKISLMDSHFNAFVCLTSSITPFLPSSLSRSMANVHHHWSMGQRSPSLSTSMDLKSPSLSTSMENGSRIFIPVYEHGEWSLLSICFLPYRENWALRIRRSSFAPCSPTKASYQESHESNRQIHRSRDDFIGTWTGLDPIVEEIIDP